MEGVAPWFELRSEMQLRAFGDESTKQRNVAHGPGQGRRQRAPGLWIELRPLRHQERQQVSGCVERSTNSSLDGKKQRTSAEMT